MPHEQSQLVQEYISVMSGRELMPPIHNVLPLVPTGSVGIAPYVTDFYSTIRTDDIPFFQIGNSEQTIVYLPLSLIKEITAEAFDLYWHNQDSFYQFLDDRFRTPGSSVMEQYQAYNEGKTFDVHLAIEASKKLNAFSWFTLYFDEIMFSDFIEKHDIAIPKEKRMQLWQKVSTPYFESLDRRRERIILEEIKAGMQLEQIAKQYHHFFQNYNSFTSHDDVMEELIDQYQNLTQSEIEARLAEIQQANQKLQEEKKKICIEDFDETEELLFNFIQCTMHTRDERKDYIAAALSLQLRVAHAALREAGLPETYINFLYNEEALQGAPYLKENEEAIEERQAGFALLSDMNGQTQIETNVSFENSRDAISRHIYGDNNDQQEQAVSGFVGNTGQVKGVVRIVRDPKEEKFTDGDILVTGMTRPEFIPLMKKASAIITDEGGITCHAAIVSRELGIPCVIGTQNATRILQSGDTVFVDADSGEVTIISH